MSQDGQVVFPEKGGTRGAAVLTANGVEFLDQAETPHAVVRRSAFEPWRPPTGFLLPGDGIWRETSQPIALQGNGLAVVLRSSDVFVPTWGGEILLRMDVIVPAAAFPAKATTVRAPRWLAIVIDGHHPNTPALVDVALEDLGERDRVVIVDSAGARAVVPLVPGNHRTLLEAAVERVVAGGIARSANGSAPVRDLAGALSVARLAITSDARRRSDAAVPPLSRQVLLVTDGANVASVGVARELGTLRAARLELITVGAPDDLDAGALSALGGELHVGGPFSSREDAVAAAVPPPGDTVLEDVVLTISSAPAPTHIVEASGGSTESALELDRMELGELYAGEARTEVLRLSIPPWTAGEPLDLAITARYRDVASGRMLTAAAPLRCRYSNDVAQIASMRHGDVIAYASALAMVRRLDRAFMGRQIDRLGGLRPLVAWQARSLGTLARTQHDSALGVQAELLSTLLAAVPD
jgi:hypothetical protein